MIYCIIGVQFYWEGSYYFLGFDHKPNLNRIYNLIAIFSIFFLVTYFIIINAISVKKIISKALSYKIKNYRLLNFYCTFVFFFTSFVLFEDTAKSYNSIAHLLLNSLIPIIGFLIINKYKISFLYLALFTGIAIFFGFRYRLALLYLPIVLFYFSLRRDYFKNFQKYLFLALFFIFTVAALGVARNYSQGLDVSKLTDYSLSDLLIVGIFNDTNTILTSGTFIDWFDRYGQYALLNQITYTLEYFIPAFLFESKTYSPILEYTRLSIRDYTSGAAVLGFAEYYHTAGIVGVIFFSILISSVLTVLYKKQVVTGDLYHRFFYLCLLVWFINSLTRGYFPQNASDLTSILLGFYFIRAASVRFRLLRLQDPR